MAFTAEDLKRIAGKIRVKEIDVPELGGTVYIREVTAGEFDKIQILCSNADNPDNMTRATCVAHFASDAEGNRLFSDADIKELNQMNGKAIDEIFSAGFEFNKVDGLEKN